MENKEKGVWSSGRLTIGIVSIVLFLLIALQSCAVGVGNALEENGSTSGSSGILCAFVYLVGGILGIVMRNAKGIAGLVVTSVFYLLGFLISLADRADFGDLAIWGGLSLILAVFYIVCAIKTKQRNKEN
ncbi:MAG: hypothetical protein MR316_06410 [Lachnospiraceae bacterium]|nr:hypothetical protein [Lachnospiraceae bacterium]